MGSKQKVLSYGMLFLVFFAPALLAAPQLKVDPLPDKVPEKQIARLTVSLEWPQAEGPYEVQFTEPLLENLELVHQRQSQETGPVIRQALTYEFRPVKTGEAAVVPFEVRYRAPGAGEWTPVLVPRQSLKVVRAFPLKPLLIASGILAGLALAAVLGLALKKIAQRRAEAEKTVPPDPKQLIFTRAREAVEAFASADPKARLSHYALQLRHVVHAYYDLPPEAATEPEVLAALRKKGLPAGEWNEVSGLFDQLEQMRFSHQDLSAYAIDRIRKTLLQYIQGKIIIGNSNS